MRNTNTVEKLSDYIMNCEEVKDLSSDYIECNCSDFNSMAVTKHIEHCNNCSQFIDEMRQLNTWSKSLANTEIPQDVSKRLREKLGLA